VLIDTAQRLRLSGRTGDLLARLSGDEFVMVCADASADDAVDIAERAVAALQRPMLVDGRSYSLAASVGVATSSSAPGNSDALVRAADHAMYDAKRRGGSAVRLHGPADATPGVGAAVSWPVDARN
jgi:diguanylate cyclase (GGDEF)-like protein